MKKNSMIVSENDSEFFDNNSYCSFQFENEGEFFNILVGTRPHNLPLLTMIRFVLYVDMCMIVYYTEDVTKLQDLVQCVSRSI